MAKMFNCLGHILHLNQDTSSPDHVRNVAHKDGAYFEDYGQDNCASHTDWFTNQPHGWAYWQNRGFSKLLDFWDRNLYNNNSSAALIAEAAGTTNLGLAEFDNGNFLGDRSFYSECYDNHNNKHYFPFPSVTDTDHKNLNPNNLEGSVREDELRSLKQWKRVYIKKTGAGVVVTNHSALTYEELRNLGRNIPKRVAFTINDVNVLQEYHSILLPKAVEYSAGLLDYFFRGIFTLQVSGDDSSSTFTVHNTSGQDFSGGAFFLLLEANGVRTLVKQYLLADILPNGILSNGGSVNLTYAGAATNKYLCFYQGTIGITNGTDALDPVDAGISVAISLPPPITVTANPLWTDSGLVVTNGQTLMILAPGS
jgi:hypothetical protein